MNETANNQCPNCGHRFSDREMLFWGLSKTSKCPDCDVELGVNSNRMLLLWFGGIVAILFLEQLFSLQSFHGWLAIAVFLLAFCLLAVKLQKLEIKK
jgi:CXXC-20-CXXC protein